MDTQKSTSPIHVIIAVFITLASTAMGLIGGFLAELLYASEDPPVTGWIYGIVAGLIVGIAYVTLLTRQRRTGKWPNRFILAGTAAGTLAGIIAAAAVHIALMILYAKFDLKALGIGILCGAPAGTILGLISAWLLKIALPQSLPQINTEDQNNQ